MFHPRVGTGRDEKAPKVLRHRAGYLGGFSFRGVSLLLENP